MNLRERLTKVAEDAIKEGVESSKDIIGDNVVPSFDDMGMANVQPGEFAQEEITDKQNLVNQGSMSNDTEFNKEDCPVEKAVDAAEEMLSDLVDISAPETDSTIEIVKTTAEEHPEDCHCPECCHKHHHEQMGESKLEEENKPLFMYNPQLETLYYKWNDVLLDPKAKRPQVVNNEVIEDLNRDGLTPETCTASQFVWNDMNNAMADYETKAPDAWNSLVDKLKDDARHAPDVSAEDLEAFDVLHANSQVNLESAKNEFGESAMAKAITKLLNGKTCEEYLKEAVQLKESDYAGPRDWNPDTRINASDVLNAIKQEVGEGSEGVHVVKDLDERKDPIYRVTQIDKDKLPKTLKVETIELKWEDNAYRPQSETKEAPLPR